MALDFTKIIIIDLEATCWSGKTPKGVHHDVIEYGVAVLEVASGNILANEGILVKPTTSTVSDFCTELTTITPDMVADAPSFSDASQYLKDKYQANRHPWASYGAYDMNQLKRQCLREKVPFPLSAQHLNVKALFALRHHLSHPVGMDTALKQLEIPLEGTHHRGIDDARNIAKILRQLL
ncbi:3'-5' exonuclease [Lewinella cohaerens]|uniref:3'-5' exonuclease n=1 Tax=Lewinella cohaerens TaxID=70995 RepID=UPI000370C2B8|nr:3'-5' exonuclease [Lewinella cohaerens]